MIRRYRAGGHLGGGKGVRPHLRGGYDHVHVMTVEIETAGKGLAAHRADAEKTFRQRMGKIADGSVQKHVFRQQKICLIKMIARGDKAFIHRCGIDVIVFIRLNAVIEPL